MSHDAEDNLDVQMDFLTSLKKYEDFGTCRCLPRGSGDKLPREDLWHGPEPVDEGNRFVY